MTAYNDNLTYSGDFDWTQFFEEIVNKTKQHKIHWEPIYRKPVVSKVIGFRFFTENFVIQLYTKKNIFYLEICSNRERFYDYDNILHYKIYDSNKIKDEDAHNLITIIQQSFNKIINPFEEVKSL